MLHLSASYPECVHKSRDSLWAERGIEYPMFVYHALIPLLCNLTASSEPPQIALKARLAVSRSPGFTALVCVFGDDRHLFEGSRQRWMALFTGVASLLGNVMISEDSIPPTVRHELMSVPSTRSAICRLYAYGMYCRQTLHGCFCIADDAPEKGPGPQLLPESIRIHHKVVRCLPELCDWDPTGPKMGLDQIAIHAVRDSAPAGAPCSPSAAPPHRVMLLPFCGASCALDCSRHLCS